MMKGSGLEPWLHLHTIVPLQKDTHPRTVGLQTDRVRAQVAEYRSRAETASPQAWAQAQTMIRDENDYSILLDKEVTLTVPKKNLVMMRILS